MLEETSCLARQFSCFQYVVASVALETEEFLLEGKEARLENLLHQYARIFEEPTTLPPHRSCNNQKNNQPLLVEGN